MPNKSKKPRQSTGFHSEADFWDELIGELHRIGSEVAFRIDNPKEYNITPIQKRLLKKAHKGLKDAFEALTGLASESFTEADVSEYDNWIREPMRYE